MSWEAKNGLMIIPHLFLTSSASYFASPDPIWSLANGVEKHLKASLWCIIHSAKFFGNYPFIQKKRPFRVHPVEQTHIKITTIMKITISKSYPHFFQNILPSLKLTYPLKMVVFNRNLLFQRSIFGGYVSFREGIFFIPYQNHHQTIFPSPPPPRRTRRGPGRAETPWI